MEPETLALYVFAGVLSTIGFIMLYMEAKRNRLPEDPEAGKDKETDKEKDKSTEKKTGKKGRAKK